MEILERMAAWVSAFPGFSGWPVTLSRHDGAVNSLSLFPGQDRLLEEKANVLGQCTQKWEKPFTLYFTGPAFHPQTYGTVLDFTKWVRQEGRFIGAVFPQCTGVTAEIKTQQGEKGEHSVTWQIAISLYYTKTY